jgi:DNA-binding PadR family transcriptional regulator
MSIQYAILGFLSWQALSGYDLKKLFEASTALYWSGNNNQIYRALIQLRNEGLVTVETRNQTSGPSKKIYTITQQGRDALRAWVGAAPEAPLLRNGFLVQLAWADQLSPAELDGLLARYEDEVEAQLLICREQRRRDELNPARTERETMLWHAVAENPVRHFAAELAWVQQLRQQLAAAQP